MTTMKKRKKILYVASTASHLQRFHEPYLLELRKTCDVCTMANGDGVDYPIPFSKKILSLKHFGVIRQIRQICKKEAFDAVILNTSLAAALTRIALRNVKPHPYVMNVVHGYLFSYPPKGFRDHFLLWCERRLYRQTDTIAVMNAHDLGAANAYRLCTGNVTFLKGMGMKPFTIPQPHEALRLRFAAFRDVLLTFVGELSGRKNQIFLIRAVAKLREEGLPVRLLLIGSGDKHAALIREIGKLGLGESVAFAGERENVLPYLAITDIYVSASKSEGLPFNILEAMQCGLPVLASDVRGHQDLLPSDHLYPLNDLDAFCASLRKMVLKGPLGMQSVKYPHLKKYLLPAVFKQNMKIIRQGVAL